MIQSATQSQLIAAAAFGSFALLAGAFIFQTLGYAPCAMCLWQRYPHAVAILIGVLALSIKRYETAFAVIGALAALRTAYFGAYHTGVERGWWAGPESCTGDGLDTSNLLSLDVAPIVMCDDVVWSLAGLSMASYNAIFSLGLAAIWIAAATRR